MFQQITIVGNLGRDPEMRYMPDGSAVTNLNVATSRKWKNRQTGENEEETTWFRVSVWGAQAEACNTYLSKGKKVLILGTLKPDPNTGSPRIWERSDGTAGASFEVTANMVRFLSGRDDGDGFSAPAGAGASSSAPAEEDDIPF